MQPVQLSLLPEQYPAPAKDVLCQLPANEVAEAIELLARLIAATVTSEGEVSDGE